MDTLERVAQALCDADGVDPEQLKKRGDAHLSGGGRMSAVTELTWDKYLQEARRFIAAHKALAVTGNSTGSDADHQASM